MTSHSATPLPDAGWLDELSRLRGAFSLPPRATARAGAFADDVLAFLFPHFAPALDGDRTAVRRELDVVLRESIWLFADFLGYRPGSAGGSTGTDEHVVVDGTRGEREGREFVSRLPALCADLLTDAGYLVASDPAATSIDEVILAYPGFFATACYRVAHLVRHLGVPLLPRLITEYAHQRTGIDIHPGAEIGVPFAIDHGTGIVIGETATVGVRVRLYQGVTLGALSVEKGLASAKRHPTIGDDVVLYANATVLGGRTVVGAGSVVGGNVWLTRSVPERSVVVHQAMHTHTSESPALEFHI